MPLALEVSFRLGRLYLLSSNQLPPSSTRHLHRYDRGLRFLAWDKDVFDGHLKKMRNSKSQRQAGVVSFGFQGVDRLPRDLQPLSEIGLGPTFGFAMGTKRILHRYRRRISVTAPAYTKDKVTSGIATKRSGPLEPWAT